MKELIERYVTPCPLPNEYERELLTILIEECSEVQQRATKLLRFGRDEVQSGQQNSNARRLGLEIGDLSLMVELVETARLIPAGAITEGMRRKREQLAKFMQTESTDRTPPTGSAPKDDDNAN